MSAQRRNTGMIVAVLTAIAFAGSGPFVKPLLNAGWTPGAAVIMRLGLAACVVMPIALWVTRHDLGVWLRRWRWMLGYGVIAMAATQFLYFSSVALMPVGIALLIQYLAPVLLLLTAWARTKHRPAAMSLVGAGLSVAGLLLALNLFGGNGASIAPIGIAFAALAAGCVCGYYLMAAAVPDDLPATALTGGGLVIGTLTLVPFAVLGAIPVHFEFGSVVLIGAERPWWVSMTVVVCIGTVAGYLGGAFAAKTLGSRLASFLGLLEVLATLIVSALMLGEIPTLVQAAGAALVICGVVCVRLAPDTVTVDAPLGPVTAPITLPVDLAELEAIRLETHEDVSTASIPVIREVDTLTAQLPVIRQDPPVPSA